MHLDFHSSSALGHALNQAARRLAEQLHLRRSGPDPEPAAGFPAMHGLPPRVPCPAAARQGDFSADGAQPAAVEVLDEAARYWAIAYGSKQTAALQPSHRELDRLKQSLMRVFALQGTPAGGVDRTATDQALACIDRLSRAIDQKPGRQKTSELRRCNKQLAAALDSLARKSAATPAPLPARPEPPVLCLPSGRLQTTRYPADAWSLGHQRLREVLAALDLRDDRSPEGLAELIEQAIGALRAAPLQAGRPLIDELEQVQQRPDAAGWSASAWHQVKSIVNGAVHGLGLPDGDPSGTSDPARARRYPTIRG